MALHFHKLAVKDIQHETKDCVSIAFDIPKELEKIFHLSKVKTLPLKQISVEKKSGGLIPFAVAPLITN